MLERRLMRGVPNVIAGTLFALLLLLFVYSVAEILLLLFIAILFSLYLGAVTDALQRHVGMPRPVGLLTALLLTALAVAGIAALIIPPVLDQTHQLIQTLPAQLTQLEARLLATAQRSPLVAQFLGPLSQGESYVGTALQELGRYLRSLVPYVFGGVRLAIDVISVFVMGIYMTLRPGMYREGFIALAPLMHRDLVRDLLAELGQTLRAWIVGQMLAMVSLGLLTWIGLVLLDVPYALAFGVFTGAVAIVPFFGTLVSTLLPALFVLGSAGFVKALLVVLLGVVVHIIEANIVAPMIMERQVQLPPVLTLLSVLIMAHLLHIIGLLVAVPVLATVMVIGRRIYVQRIVEGKGFRRAIRDQPLEVRLPAEGVILHPSAQETSLPGILER